MVDKQDYQQLELFTSEKGEYTPVNQGGQGNFFRHIRNHEKVILVLIAGLIVGLICFSLGVEKGKRVEERVDVLAASKPQVELPVPVPKAVSAPVVLPVVARQQLNTVKPLPVAGAQKFNFTIQLASYQNKASAQKEAEGLKKKGLLPILLTKGKYTTLCVGYFTTKETAQSTLSDLRKRYRDCFIRRL